MERGQFFHWSWNYKDFLNQYIKNENIKKDLVNLTEANHHINTTCNLLQAITRLKAFWMLRVSTCFSHCNSCAKQGDSASVSVSRVSRIRVMVIQLQEKTGKNPHHRLYQRKHHLMVIVMKKTLNVNKTCWQ